MPKWKKPIPMPDYLPSPEQQKWHKHCVDKGIIISPIGIQGEKKLNIFYSRSANNF